MLDSTSHPLLSSRITKEHPNTLSWTFSFEKWIDIGTDESVGVRHQTTHLHPIIKKHSLLFLNEGMARNTCVLMLATETQGSIELVPSRQGNIVSFCSTFFPVPCKGKLLAIDTETEMATAITQSKGKKDCGIMGWDRNEGPFYLLVSLGTFATYSSYPEPCPRRFHRPFVERFGIRNKSFWQKIGFIKDVIVAGTILEHTILSELEWIRQRYPGGTEAGKRNRKFNIE